MRERLLYERIEAYLTGQMPQEEARLFEQQMAADENLATEVELQRLEHDAMEVMLEKDLKDKMAKWDKEPPPNPFGNTPANPGKSGNKFKWWLPALVAAFLAFWAIYSLVDKDEPSQPATGQPGELQPQQTNPAQDVPIANTPPEESEKSPDRQEKTSLPTPQRQESQNAYLALALDAYETPSFSSGQRGNDGAASVFEKAALAFNEKKYRETLALLANPEAGNQSQVRYLRGHAYFNLNIYKAAETEFKAVAADDFAPDFFAAEWNLLLTYLAQMPQREASYKALSEKIAADTTHPFHDKAATILTEIK